MPPRLFVIVSVALALAASPAAARAQSTTSAATPLAPGTRVRVSAVQRRDAITGVVVSHSADSLVVRSDRDSSTVALARVQVARVDVSRGRHSQMLKGAAYGLLGGAGIGALTGLTLFSGASCDANAEFGLCLGPGFGAAVGATLFGAVGALVGTLVGSYEREQWSPAPAASAREARLRITPVRGGLALSASLPF